MFSKTLDVSTMLIFLVPSGIRSGLSSLSVDFGKEFPGLANVPPHLELDKPKLSAKITGRCEREWVAIEINELLVVEYYSRKV